MTNTPLRGQLRDALAGREPLSAEDEEQFQLWAKRQPWFLSHQNRTGFEPDLRALDFDPRSVWETERRRDAITLARGDDIESLVGGGRADDLALNGEAGDGPLVLSAKEFARQLRKWGVRRYDYPQGETRVPASPNSPKSDCSGFVQQWLEGRGYRFDQPLTTGGISKFRGTLDKVIDPQPGDIIVKHQGGRGHMGIFMELRNGRPMGLQLGDHGFAVGDWGPGRSGWFGQYGANVEYYRPRPLVEPWSSATPEP
jgi:hypothetical protein